MSKFHVNILDLYYPSVHSKMNAKFVIGSVVCGVLFHIDISLIDVVELVNLII